MNASDLIRSIEPSPSTSVPVLEESLIIDKLAPGSLAEASGLETGDVILKILDQPANNVDLLQALIEYDSVSYLVYQPGKHTLVKLITEPVPLGVVLVKSNETVLAAYRRNPDEAEYEDLYPIWNRAEAEALKNISRKAFNPLKMKLLSMMNRMPYSPEYLFYGAALYDLGDRQSGIAAIRAFDGGESDTYSMQQNAMVNYYEARELLAAGGKDAAVELMEEAFSLWHHARIQKDLLDLTGQHYEYVRQWPGKTFEMEYELEQIEFGSGLVSLNETTSKMADDQVLLICILGGYRANYFYNSFMQRFLAFKKSFKDRIFDMHVITSDPEKVNHPGFFYYENQAVNLLGPITLLHDPDWLLVDYLEPHSSPTVYALNNQRQILYEGEMNEYDIWRIMNDLAANGAN